MATLHETARQYVHTHKFTNLKPVFRPQLLDRSCTAKKISLRPIFTNISDEHRLIFNSVLQPKVGLFVYFLSECEPVCGDVEEWRVRPDNMSILRDGITPPPPQPSLAL